MNFDFDFDRFVDAFESYKLITISFVLLVISFFVLFVFISPRYVKIKEINKSIKRYEQSINKKRQKNTLEIKRLEDSTDLKEKYTQLKSRYFSEEEYTDFVVTGIKNLAEHSKVNIVNYRLGAFRQINDELVSYPFVVEISGGYANVRKFIKELEEYKKILTMADFSLAKKVKIDTNYPEIRTTLRLDLYTANTKKKEKKKNAKTKK